jgi:DMSO/TMAO reductase YedYZ molybdopterin-dependent catalytic subunit
VPVRDVVASVDYRLAPEYKFSARIDDCLHATRWAAAHAADLITPTDLHYTVQHFAVPPVIETTDWGLRVFGEVKNSLTLNFDQLRRFPACTARTRNGMFEQRRDLF